MTVNSESEIKDEVARFRQMLQEIQKQESLAYISPARWAEELWKSCVAPHIKVSSTLWSRTSTIQRVTKSQFAALLCQEQIQPLVDRAFKDASCTVTARCL